jgi:hypothetical protein
MIEMDVEDVIVVVKHKNSFYWYKSSRELWVLDLEKWTKDFREAGFQVPESDPSFRFGIPVVDVESLPKFMTEMRQFEISKKNLTSQLIVRFPTAKSWWDVSDLFPMMFVDFDRKHVCAFYPEGTPMERYIPDGWTGEFEDFLTQYSEAHFPLSEKYWIIDGLDLLHELNERGKRFNQT